MKWVPLLPSHVGSQLVPIQPRDASLPPLMVNPWAVSCIAPSGATEEQCAVMLNTGQVLLMPMTADQVIRLLTGDLH